MNEKNLKKHKIVMSARKYKLRWILKTLLWIFLIIFIFFLTGYFFPNLFLFLLIPGFIFLFIFVYYRIYILILAELYQCNCCGSKFYISFVKYLFSSFLSGNSNRSKFMQVTTAVDNDKQFMWSTTKCPNCGNLLILSDCEVKND